MRDYVLSLLVIVLAAALFVSDRNWFASNRPVVTHVADLPQLAEVRDPELMIAYGGLHVPRPQSKAEQAFRYLLRSRGIEPVPPSFRDSRTPPRFGYAVREVSFLGMPFAYYTDLGWVLYTRSDWGFVAMPLSAKGQAMVARAAGRDPREGFVYPFWRHLWGWLFVAGLGWWAYLRHNHIVRTRAELGLI